MVPGFFRQSAHGVGERQRRAIVGKTEASRDGPAIIVELPIGNFHKIACAFCRRERTDPAPAGRASLVRKRRRHAAKPALRRPGYPSKLRLAPNSSDVAV